MLRTRRPARGRTGVGPLRLPRIGAALLAALAVIGCSSPASTPAPMPTLAAGWTEHWGPAREFRIGLPLGFTTLAPQNGALFGATSPGEGSVSVFAEAVTDLNAWLSLHKASMLESGVDLRMQNVSLPGGQALTATFSLMEGAVQTQYVFPVPGGILKLLFTDTSFTSSRPKAPEVWPVIATTFYPAAGYTVAGAPAGSGAASSPAPSSATVEATPRPIPSAAPASAPPPTTPPAATSAPGPTVALTARNIAFEQSAIAAPARTPFTIRFDNQDLSILHGVVISDAEGAAVFKGELTTGVSQTDYAVPALEPGAYRFLCAVHPTMVGTLTVGSAASAESPAAPPTDDPGTAYKPVSIDAWQAILASPVPTNDRIRVWTCARHVDPAAGVFWGWTAPVAFSGEDLIASGSPVVFVGSKGFSVQDDQILRADIVVLGGGPSPMGDGTTVPIVSLDAYETQPGSCR